jgi:uncharacterized surface protein with fasciclin (FAS1) repeats
MRKKSPMVRHRLSGILGILTLLSTVLISCHEEYYYDDREPGWLGSSIYNLLDQDPKFSYTIRLINDLDYAEVMKLTGSKTLFVARDSSYESFFANNDWGVSNYEGLSKAQKKMLFRYAMINNAYLVETMQDYYSDGTFYEGLAMRRPTSLEALDSIPFVSGSELPENSYWDEFRTKGLFLLQDETDWPVVFFGQDFINKYSLTDEDFRILCNGKTRSNKDFHLFDDKVISRDSTCKNGYVHVLEDVLVPRKNLAQYVVNNPKTRIFAKLMERFSLPVFDQSATSTYWSNNVGFADSIYKKEYFASNGGTMFLPGTSTTADYSLNFDPGWNNYGVSSVYGDMAAMFIPTDDAMNNYIESGIGQFLKVSYGSWDNVPDKVVLPFLNRHMRTSFIESIPSRFSTMVDGENYALPVTIGDVDETYTCVNGQAYVTNKVYPPVDFVSVYSPILLSDLTKVFRWGINVKEEAGDGTIYMFYKLYLNSLVNKYSVFVPTDEYMQNYLDPIAYGQSQKAMMKYWMDSRTGTDVLKATVYKYDETTNVLGDSVDVYSEETADGLSFLKNRLWNILDSHVVVGGVESGDGYYITKGNDLIKVEGSGTSMTIQGGRDLEKATKSNVTAYFEQENGNTYFLDKPIGSSLNSVYSTMENKLEFTEFFNLLNEIPDTCVMKVFETAGVDKRVSFFNAYRYTIYIPTDSAVKAAIADGRITPWETISAMSNTSARNESIQKMIRFLRYHFQDNAVFFGQDVNDQYLSATLKQTTESTRWNTGKNKFYKIGVVGNANSMTLTTDKSIASNGGVEYVAHVSGDPDLHNIITKDFIFEALPSAYKNVDGTGSTSGSNFVKSLIATSASAVIHQIDNVLCFQ